MPGPGRPAKGRPPKSSKGKAPAKPPRAGDAARKIGELVRAVGSTKQAKKTQYSFTAVSKYTVI